MPDREISNSEIAETNAQQAHKLLQSTQRRENPEIV